MIANSPDFPRGKSEASDHEALATARWIDQETVKKALGADSEAISPISLGWLEGSGKQQLMSYDDDSHIVTVAGSRAGKGVSLILPNLLSYKGSVICVDLKGENCAVTAKWRKENLGQKVIELDPYKIVTQEQHAFNPLEFLDVDSPELIDDLTDLADALVVRGDNKDAHWDETGRAVIRSILLFILRMHEPGDRKLGYLRQYVLEGVEAIEGEGPSFENMLAAMAGSGDPLLRGMAFRLKDMGNDEFGSVMSTVQRNTEFLDSPRIQDVVGDTTFDPKEIRDHPNGVTIYLVLPEWRLAGQNRWLRLMLTVLLQSLQKNPKRSAKDPSVLVILDEFAALGHLQVIERAAGYIAGFGVKLWSILQDLAQLKDIYAKRWETFLGNAGIFTAFGNIDLTTLDYISKRLGKCETHRIEQTFGENSSLSATGGEIGKGVGGGSGESASYSPKTVLTPLLQPDEVGRIFGRKSGNLLILIGGAQPIWAHRISYHEQEPFKSRAAPSPYHL